MSAMSQRHRTVPLCAMIIAYGAPAIAMLVYLTWWPVSFHTILTRHQPINLHGPLWTYPFNDLDAVLHAIACARQGIDVTLPNACMGGGLFQYSPLLLKASTLPIGPALRIPLGLGLDVLFLLSLYALPRPRRWCEFWSLLLAALSYSSLWALESANIDVALYLLVLLAAHLLLRDTGTRAVGYATLLIADAIKFYPACLLVLAARERPAHFVPIALTSLAAAVLLAVAFAGQMGHILPRLPHGSPFGGTFAASNLPSGLAMLMSGSDPDGAISCAIGFVSMFGLIVLCALNVRQWVPTLLPTLRTIAPRQRTLLVAGAVTMTFCFLTAHNFLYRQIFLILTLPGLWDLERRAPQPAWRARFRLASWVAVGLMWAYLFHMLSVVSAGLPGGHLAVIAAIVVWLVQETLWWWLIGLFAAIVACLLWDAPVLAHWRARGVTRRTRSAG